MMSPQVTVTDRDKSAEKTARPSAYKDFIVLIKARMGLLAAIIALAGYYMGSSGPVSGLGMFHVFMGTWIVCAGAFLLNMYVDRDLDARMERTSSRPLPAGRVSPGIVFYSGLVVSIIGIGYLGWSTNLLAAASGALAVAGYVMVYTPLKRVTTLNTIVGSFPGAMPPIIGWAAAADEITMGAVIMFLILFMWQIPHFLALAWMYRDEYRDAGFVMISHDDPEGTFTTRQNLIYAIAFVLITLLPLVFGLAGYWYTAVAALSGVYFLWLCLQWFAHRERKYAVHVFIATLFHVPLLYGVMVLDKGAVLAIVPEHLLQ